MISKTFCILPWIHFYANPDGSVLPCCIGDHRKPLGNVQQQSIEKIWNNSRYKKMRSNMLQGQRCEECTACYNAEDSGVNSFRNSSNKEYKEFFNLLDETHSDGFLNVMNIKYLDIRWSNICNFKCRSCSSTYSSSWATEDNKHGQNKKILMFAGGENNDNLYQQILPFLNEVKEIYFAGGEPLLMDKHYDILNYLISTGNTDIKLRYNTNLSSLTYKNKSVIDLWKSFSNVHLNISLDSWDQRAEYIREGTEWNTIVKNIQTVRNSCTHLHIGIASVISAFNVYTLPEFIEYMIEHKLVDSNTTVSFYSIQHPSFYSFNILEENIKNKIINKLKSKSYPSSVSTQIDNVIKQLESSVTDKILQKSFKHYTDYYDSIRNKNFVSTFPELKELYESIL